MIADPVTDTVQAFNEFNLARDQRLSLFRHLGLMPDYFFPSSFPGLQAFRYWRTIVTYLAALEYAASFPRPLAQAKNHFLLEGPVRLAIIPEALMQSLEVLPRFPRQESIKMGSMAKGVCVSGFFRNRRTIRN